MAIPNYRVLLSFDPERKLFTACAPELEHCQGEGPSRAAAVAQLEEEIGAQVENMLAHGSNPPPPLDAAALSGELRAKVSQGLHRDLLWLARTEGVELEALIPELLAAGVETRRGARARGGPRVQPQRDPVANDNIGNTVAGGARGGRTFAGPGRGGGYNTALLDDRANFIEYVRNLEQGGGSPGPRGPGGGGPGGGGGGRNRRRGAGGSGGGRGPGGGPGGSPGGGPGGGGGRGPGGPGRI